MKKIAMLALLAASMTFAQTAATSLKPKREKAPMARRAKAHRKIIKGLGLTEPQKQQAKALFQQSKQNAEPVVRQLKQNRQELAAAVKSNDSGRIQQLSSQQGNLRGQLLSMRADTRAKFLSTLTPDQRARAERMKPQFKDRVKPRAKQRVNG